jgi:hypothetical protein
MADGAHLRCIMYDDGQKPQWEQALPLAGQCCQAGIIMG